VSVKLNKLTWRV